MIKNVFIQPRFYKLIAIAVVLFVGGVFHPVFYILGFVWLVALMGTAIFDMLSLQKNLNLLTGNRRVLEKLSLGDEQTISYKIRNESTSPLAIELIDELPYQFQHRSPIAHFTIEKGGDKSFEFNIFPKERGDYLFGELGAFVSNPRINLVQIKHNLDREYHAKVYPSILQMKKYALHVFRQTAHFYGIRKIRTIGENDEFEHIRNYQIGDNEKSINWKATSRRGELLVNQFQDTRSQNVYNIIDKGRSMEMPFNGLTLLDHSINTALVISNITLQKYDKAGLITFCDKIDGVSNAQSSGKQLEHIMQTLYAQSAVFKESNFELLYLYMRKRISKRSIVFLYTNFENKTDLDRNIDYLKLISKQHLLVIILFVNTELFKRSEVKTRQIADVYNKTIAQSLLYEKEEICKELNRQGIQTILTRPEDLSVNVINKYLEIKAKRSK